MDKKKSATAKNSNNKKKHWTCEVTGGISV